jgi:hypothetical protein
VNGTWGRSTWNWQRRVCSFPKPNPAQQDQPQIGEVTLWRLPRIRWQPATTVLAVPWGKLPWLLSLEEGPDHCSRVSGRPHLRFADFHGQGDADGLSASVFGDDAIAARNFLNSVLSIATKRNGCKPIGADEQGLSSSAMASTDPMCVEKSSSTTAPELNGLST